MAEVEQHEKILKCPKCAKEGTLDKFGWDKPVGDYEVIYLCPRCKKLFRPKQQETA